VRQAMHANFEPDRSPYQSQRVGVCLTSRPRTRSVAGTPVGEVTRS
jgi:hypothetical protein